MIELAVESPRAARFSARRRCAARGPRVDCRASCAMRSKCRGVCAPKKQPQSRQSQSNSRPRALANTSSASNPSRQMAKARCRAMQALKLREGRLEAVGHLAAVAARTARADGARLQHAGGEPRRRRFAGRRQTRIPGADDEHVRLRRAKAARGSTGGRGMSLPPGKRLTAVPAFKTPSSAAEGLQHALRGQRRREIGLAAAVALRRAATTLAASPSNGPKSACSVAAAIAASTR